MQLNWIDGTVSPGSRKGAGCITVKTGAGEPVFAAGLAPYRADSDLGQQDRITQWQNDTCGTRAMRCVHSGQKTEVEAFGSNT